MLMINMTEEMNTEALHVVLQQSFSPDAALRDPAERTIANLKNVKGASVMLLQVAAEKQVSVVHDVMKDILSLHGSISHYQSSLLDHDVPHSSTGSV